ncbi:substrate-binding domain-containing protein [Microbacterium lacus]|uniref:substrate-binding domain-containing protein n=1 Tax=Microbacterium lacus TaxID=415217 RepID=UPI00384DD6D9
MATRHLLGELIEAATAAGLPEVTLESVGGVEAAARVSAGERVDLVFLASDALQRLAVEGHVDEASLTPLVRSQVAIAVPSHSDAMAVTPGMPAFGDADGVKGALRAATRVGYSTGPSGIALLEMIEGWGMTAEIGERLVQARPGVPVAGLLADGEVDLGFQQLSELAGQPGVRILGVLPADCAIDTVFSGAVATEASDAAEARSILNFFVSATAPLVAGHGFDTA